MFVEVMVDGYEHMSLGRYCPCTLICTVALALSSLGASEWLDDPGLASVVQTTDALSSFNLIEFSIRARFFPENLQNWNHLESFQIHYRHRAAIGRPLGLLHIEIQTPRSERRLPRRHHQVIPHVFTLDLRTSSLQI